MCDFPQLIPNGVMLVLSPIFYRKKKIKLQRQLPSRKEQDNEKSQFINLNMIGSKKRRRKIMNVPTIFLALLEGWKM